MAECVTEDETAAQRPEDCDHVEWDTLRRVVTAAQFMTAAQRPEDCDQEIRDHGEAWMARRGRAGQRR